MKNSSKILLFWFLFLTGGALAQSVHWKPPSGQLDYNQQTSLALVFEDCEPIDGGKIPEVSGLKFGPPAVHTVTAGTLGDGLPNKIIKTYTLTFPVIATTRSPIKIPGFKIKTDKGTRKVPAATYTVREASVGTSETKADDIATTKPAAPQKSEQP